MLPKVGIFGTNALASVLIHELQRLNFELLGLWDQKLATATAWCNHFRISLPTDSIEVILKNQEVDLVFVCAPPHFHKEITTKALAAGKHVVCEPPLGLTGPDNAAIMEQALYYPSLMTLSTFGLRHVPGIVKMRQVLNAGEIGKLQSVEVDLHCGPEELLENLSYDWTCIRELCAGPLFSTVLHLVDLVYYLSGKQAYTVCGTVKRFQSNPPHFKYDEHLTREDFISWQMLLLDNNIPCTCVVNNNFPGGKFALKLTLTGSKGALTLTEGTIFCEKYDSSARKPLCSLLEKEESEPQLQMGTKFNYRFPEVALTGMVQMCSYLKKAFEPLSERRCWISDHIADAGSFKDGQYARAVADAIKRSSETRRWMEVRVPIKKPEVEPTGLSVSLAKFGASPK